MERNEYLQNSGLNPYLKIKLGIYIYIVTQYLTKNQLFIFKPLKIYLPVY